MRPLHRPPQLTPAQPQWGSTVSQLQSKRPLGIVDKVKLRPGKVSAAGEDSVADEPCPH